MDRATLINVANTSLATKLHSSLASKLAADVVDAVLAIRPPPPPPGSKGASLRTELLYESSVVTFFFRAMERTDRPAHDRDYENAAPHRVRNAACARLGPGSRSTSSRYAQTRGERIHLDAERQFGI